MVVISVTDGLGEAAIGVDEQVHLDDRGEAAMVVISMTRSMLLERPPRSSSR